MCSIPGVEKHCRALLQEGCSGREGARHASQRGLRVQQESQQSAGAAGTLPEVPGQPGSREVPGGTQTPRKRCCKDLESYSAWRRVSL